MKPSLSLQTAINKNYAANSNGLFTAKVDQVIFNHIDCEDFKIKCLCKKLCISRMQLHRNIKKLTGLSTSEYIRRFKLKRALQLLRTTNLTVSQIAYEVGFKDPSYFTRIFVKELRISPTRLRKSWKSGQNSAKILQ